MSLYEINGLRPDIMNATQFMVNPGSTTIWKNLTSNDNQDIEVQQPFVVDISTVGINGRDTGPMTDGIWYPYILYNPTTNVAGAVVSKGLSPDLITFPPGYTWYRKLCIGLPMHGGALDLMHMAAWPQPIVSLYTPRLVGTVMGRSTTNWQPIDLSMHKPDGARLVLLTLVVSGGEGGYGYVASSQAGVFPRLENYIHQGVTSGVRCWLLDNTMYAQLIGPTNLRMDVYLDGFEMTDPA